MNKYGAIIITSDYRRKTSIAAPDIDAAMSDLQERHAPDVSAWNVSQAYGERECTGCVGRRVGRYTPDGAYLGTETVDDNFYIYTWEE